VIPLLCAGVDGAARIQRWFADGRFGSGKFSSGKFGSGKFGSGKSGH